MPKRRRFAPGRSVARTHEPRLWPLFLRQLVPLVLLGLLFFALREQLPQIDLEAVKQSLGRVSAAQWGLAMLATALSFRAVGQYDAVMHGLLMSPVSAKRARKSGVAAIAISQLAGFGVLSSALARWRLLPELGLGQSLRLSMAVSASFLLGWGIVTALVLLVAHQAPALALAGVAVAMAIAAVLLLQPRALGQLPGIKALASICFFTFADTAFAALALLALIGPDGGLEILPFFAAFLLALGAGLISGSPGGAGPFELVLLSQLPNIPDERLMAAILAFRAVYYLIPAALAVLALVAPPRKSRSPEPASLGPRTSGPYLPPGLTTALWYAPRAELALMRQGELQRLEQGGRLLALAAPVGQSLIMFADPFESKKDFIISTLQGLRECAGRMQRAAMIYKCAPRSAAIARRMGWKVVAVAHEAWLRPATFTIEGRAHRQLRRMLRKAEKAGIRVSEGGRKLPLEEMAAISEAWVRAHGGERGFSMGRFDAGYVSCQRVFLAWQGDELVAFATFHENRAEWVLDLMRQRPGTADGTMHLLIREALRSAAEMHCPRLSLASVPVPPATGDGPLARRIRGFQAARAGAEGLRRFKASFAPNWQVLHACAPGWAALAVGLFALSWRIHHPLPLAHLARQGATRPIWRRLLAGVLSARGKSVDEKGKRAES